MSKLDKMTVSKSVKRLVCTGLVARGKSQEDARAKCVWLIELGQTLASKLVPVVEAVDADFFAQLPKKERQDLLIALRRLAVAKG